MRVNFNYFISEEVFAYIVAAVALVADHGWRLMPQYRFDTATGRWHHRNGPVEPPLRLAQLHYAEDGTLQYPEHRDTAPEADLVGYLAFAHALLEALPDDLGEPASARDGVSADFTSLQWFELPAACLSPDRVTS